MIKLIQIMKSEERKKVVHSPRIMHKQDVTFTEQHDKRKHDFVNSDDSFDEARPLYFKWTKSRLNSLNEDVLKRN